MLFKNPIIRYNKIKIELESRGEGMLEDAKRSVGFFCPVCRQAVIVERSAFLLAAGTHAIECPCGKSKIEIETQGEKIKLQVPCLFCEQTHSFQCSTQAFLHEKIMAFSCGPSGLDCCYVGEEGLVFKAMDRLQEVLDALEVQAASEGMFLNATVMQEILEELRDIGQKENGIVCSCGSKNFTLEVGYSSVELCCSNCKGRLKIPAATMSDIEDLCCKTRLTINGIVTD